MTVQVAPPVPFTLVPHRLACKEASQVVSQTSFRPAWDGVVQHEEVPSSLSEGQAKTGKP